MGFEAVRQIIIEDAARLGGGATLDSDAGYAKRAGCSVPTVKRAMAELSRRGVLVRRKGHRTIATRAPAVISGGEFSFSRQFQHANEHDLVTQLLEKSCRLPERPGDADIEGEAHRSLGLRKRQPFYVITRRRVIDGIPRIIHRSYLNPAHFPPRFLVEHDFERESLLEILEQHRLRLHSRDTRIRASVATDRERAILDIAAEPVLTVQQRTYARLGGELITAEYLHGTYVRWEYVISNRK